MNMRPLKIYLILNIVGFGVNSFAQDDWHVDTSAGMDTLELDQYRRVIYSYDECKLKLVGIEESTEWTIYLRDADCRIYNLYQQTNDKDTYGFDVIFQVEGGITYRVRADNGRCRKINLRENNGRWKTKTKRSPRSDKIVQADSGFTIFTYWRIL